MSKKKNKETKLITLKNELGQIESTIAEFELNPVIIEYKNLKLKRINLNKEIYDLRYDIKMDKMKKCGIHYFAGNSKSRLCLKCGYNTDSYDEKSPEKIAMMNYEYCYGKSMQFIHKYNIDVKVAQKIYNKILEANPGIDSDTAIKYFEIALDNMIVETSYRKDMNRAKRLGVRTNKMYIERR